MTSFETFLTDVRISVMPKVIQDMTIGAETEIIDCVIREIFPANFGTKTYRELCEVQIQNSYDYDFDKNKLKNVWWHNPFDFGDVLDRIIKESLDNALHDFIDYCVKNGKHKKLLFEEYEIPVPDDDDDNFYRDFVTELVCDTDCQDGIYTTHKDIILWQENPTVQDICDKYKEQIKRYTATDEDYWEKRRAWEENAEKENKKVAEQIPSPNIQQKVTKKDKDLLKFLKENYSAQQIGLLIWSGKLEVSNKVDMMFPKPNFDYPESPPELESFLKS